MTTTDATYQGYANYETWATCLWIDNEQSIYETAIAMAAAERENAPNDSLVTDGIWSADETARFRLADVLKDLIEELLPDLDASLAADLLNAAFSSIDWHEVADHYLSER